MLEIRIKNPKDYPKIREIGSGQFGIVYVSKINDKEVAIKKIKISEESQETLKNEVSNLKELSKKSCSPNILCFLDIFKFESYVYLVTEYYEGMNFTEWSKMILSNRVAEDYLKLFESFFGDLINVLNKLKELNMVHGDIKPDNIQIAINKNFEYRPILIDFGMSCISTVNCQTSSGSLYYLSPECLIEFRKNQSLTKTSESDMWALGITFLETLGEEPWPNLRMSNFIDYVLENMKDINIETGSEYLDRNLKILLEVDIKKRNLNFI